MSVNSTYNMLCVKDFMDNECIFYKNTTYRVIKNLYQLKRINGVESSTITIIDGNGNKSKCHSTSPFYATQILTHFVNLKEVRKEKLKKIYEGNL